MKLKKLTIFGFKSFADKTEVHFDDGVTCIVGPNGCGKSNVSDSIRWVLGERSAKMLRGAKMEDVIFGGTDFRKPLGVAEVSLTIDNEDRGLPIDYSEVTITRRLYRSGESEYLLNKTVCRLKDIQDLILDTGIGSKSYSMIEQGRIDYILRAAPEERRGLIEEAAGIAKFKSKKDEALRKLARTEENLQRLNDIVNEVERNIKYAERQAKKAEKYQVEYDNLKNLEIQKVYIERDKLEQTKNDIETEKNSLKEKIAENTKSLEEHRAQLTELESTVKKLQDEYQELESNRIRHLSEVNQKKQQLQFISEKKIELAQQRGQLLQEQDQLEESLKSSTEKKESLHEELNNLSGKENEIKEQLEIKKSEFESLENQLSAKKSELENTRNEILEISSKLSTLKSTENEVKAFIEHFNQWRMDQEKSLEEFNDKIQTIEQEKSNLEHSLQELKGSEEFSANEERTLSERLESSENSLQGEKDREQSIRMKIHSEEARLSHLEKLQSQTESQIENLKEQTRDLSEFYQQLSKAVKIRDGYEWVFDLCFSHDVNLFLFQDIPAVEKLFSQHQSHLPKNFTLWAPKLTNAYVSDEERNYLESKAFSSLSQYVEINYHYEKVLSSFLKRVFICDHFEPHQLAEILEHQKESILLFKNGVMIEPSGKMLFVNPNIRDEFEFSRVKDIEDSKKSIESLRSELGQAVEKINETNASVETLKIQVEEKKKSRLEIQFQIKERENHLFHQEKSFTQLTEQKKNTEELLASRSQESSEKKESLGQLSIEISQLAEREGQIKSVEEHLTNDFEHLRSERDEKMVSYKQIQADLNHWENNLKQIQKSIALIDDHEKKDRDRLQFLESGRQKIDAKEKELSGEEVNLNENVSTLENTLREKDVELEIKRTAKENQENFLASFRNEIEGYILASQSFQEKEHQLAIKIKDLAFSEQSLIERVEQKYRLHFNDLNPEEFQFMHETAPENLEEMIEKLQKKVDSLGTVNLLAIEEYEELKERFEFLDSQRSDLETSREQLLEVIRKINRTTKKLFEDTFQNVRDQFQEYYKILFEGGEAQLVLTDEAHPLDSGIEIIVRPPGKKLQHISLLSGGEKAMTAVALLFALFKIKPSPFCVLDEVDAPLDEANIDRFLHVLQEFLDYSQFIIITHSRKTMSMGDVLYGVTMQEAGVSSVVSVKMGTDLKELEPAEGAKKKVNAPAKA